MIGTKVLCDVKKCEHWNEDPEEISEDVGRCGAPYIMYFDGVCHDHKLIQATKAMKANDIKQMKLNARIYHSKKVKT